MLDGLLETIGKVGEDVKTFITEKPLVTSAIGVGAVGATTLGTIAISKAVSNSKRKTSKPRKRKTKRGRKRDRTFKSKQKHEKKYKRKRKYKVYRKKGWINPKKRKSKKVVGKIYKTKKGQPYKILRSGKARFIKKGGKN
tara:strand:+ start:491 stop:910 length:420 start_codon:yes stop_codon:yes gene_type:complete